MTNPFVEIDISLLTEAKWNYKESNDEMQKKLTENIKRNGVVQNFIVREIEGGFYEIVNGNHRLGAVKAAGITKVMCYNCGIISDTQAKRLAIETNEIRFKSDAEMLSNVVEAILDEFNKDDFDLTSPITSDMLDNFKKQTKFEPPRPITDSPFMELGEEKDKAKDFVCPFCNHVSKIYKSSIKKEVF